MNNSCLAILIAADRLDNLDTAEAQYIATPLTVTCCSQEVVEPQGASHANVCFLPKLLEVLQHAGDTAQVSTVMRKPHNST